MLLQGADLRAHLLDAWGLVGKVLPKGLHLCLCRGKLALQLTLDLAAGLGKPLRVDLLGPSLELLELVKGLHGSIVCQVDLLFRKDDSVLHRSLGDMIHEPLAECDNVNGDALGILRGEGEHLECGGAGGVPRGHSDFLPPVAQEVLVGNFPGGSPKGLAT